MDPSIAQGSMKVPEAEDVADEGRRIEMKDEDVHITFYVIVSSIMAASAGLMFGYCIGISGGVASMDSFLLYFFPTVYEKKQGATESNYCKFSDQLLQAFTSSLYIAGLISTFAAAQTTQKLGRRPTMRISACFYIMGVALTTLSQNFTMLIFGRIILGCGVGFGNQAAPIYLSEMAPVKLRGALNIAFQLNITIGILIANLVNTGTANLGSWGWRLSFGIGAIPAILSGIGCFLLVESPNSLIERGLLEEGKAILCRVRGSPNVDLEFEELLRASKLASRIKHPFREIVKRPNVPALVIAILLQIFQQLTGINAVMFYSPVLLQTIGFGSNASLFSAVVTGLVNVLATVLSIMVVDRFGRKILLLLGGAQMFVTQVVIGVLLGIGLKDTGGISDAAGIVTVVMICVFVIAFAYSWGSMGWLIPSETFPLELRSAGLSIVVSVNLLFTFFVAQAFLSTLCAMKSTIFLMFAFFVLIMSAFVYFFIPETKGIPIEASVHLWKEHWFWKKVVDIKGEAENEQLSSPLVQP